jgi:hypothetical protein
MAIMQATCKFESSESILKIVAAPEKKNHLRVDLLQFNLTLSSCMNMIESNLGSHAPARPRKLMHLLDLKEWDYS